MIRNLIKKNIFIRKVYFGFFNVFFRIKNFIQKKIMRSSVILLYHRVDNPSNDPLLLSVSPDVFEQQLKYLKDNFIVVKLSELVEDIKNKKIDKNKVSITFDDGYEDNLIKALPILEKLNIPATIFVTTKYMGEDGSFYWEKDVIPQDKGVPLSKESLIKLAKSDLIEIGSHTINHPNLKSLEVSEQKKEILDSKVQLETILNKKIKSFSYPFGTNNYFSKTTEKLVVESGYESACANNQGRVTMFSDIFALPRILVRNNFKDFKNKL